MGEGRGGSRSSDKAHFDQKEDEQAESKALVSHTGYGVRHSLALWAFLGFANLFILRIDMSIALVAMATQNSTASGSNSSHVPMADNLTECQSDDASTATTKAPAEFDWSNTLQGFILSAFYYGYFATQIPGGMLARHVGGKNLFTLSVAGCSALALLIPISARFHVGLLIAVRVLQGCLQGLVFPAMQVVLSKWAPAIERSRFVAFTYAGCQAGTVVGMLSAGYLCDTSIGWPIVFYIEGVLGLLWCVGWTLFTSESPLQHSRITETEKRYIESSVDRPQQQELQTPWRSILTSPALYAIAAAHFANDWGCFAVMTCLPKFLKDILYYDLTQNGLLSSLPYLVTWVCNFIAGALADFLRKPNRLRTVHVRKIMVCLGLLGPASLLLAAAYLPGCGRVAVVVLLTVAMGFSGFTVAGHSVNHLDIAPPFAGIMFAMTNTFGTTSGFIGPALAGALTSHHDTRHSWQTFFLISGAIYACGGSIFVLFARGDVQPWARFKDTDIESILPGPGYGSVQAHPQQEEEEEGRDSDDGRLTS